jgi:cellulose synthase/poly-beta-1,6-N-acetylglucosamine synthase-like glycosyltransferase
LTWFWLLAAPAILLALLSLAGEWRRTAYVRDRLRQRPASLPPASIIVPVKGHDDNLRLNLAMLAAQDYPDCEVIVTARTATDIPAGVLPSGVKVVVPPRRRDRLVGELAGRSRPRHRGFRSCGVGERPRRAKPGRAIAVEPPHRAAGVGEEQPARGGEAGEAANGDDGARRRIGQARDQPRGRDDDRSDGEQHPRPRPARARIGADELARREPCRAKRPGRRARPARARRGPRRTAW